MTEYMSRPNSEHLATIAVRNQRSPLALNQHCRLLLSKILAMYSLILAVVIVAADIVIY